MPDKYSEALADLDRLRAAGKLDQQQYDQHRARLLAEAGKQPKRPLWVRLAIFVAIVVAAVLVLGTCSGGGDKKVSESGAERSAIRLCRESVREQLKAPSTAKFVDESATGSGGEGAYTVSGSVDAENSFGAPIRSSFTCTAKLTGGEAQTATATLT